MIHRELCREALKSFHEANFAHNNITREHVLITSGREATFIGLKGCDIPHLNPVEAPSRMARDSIKLNLCLGISQDAPSQSHDEGTTSPSEVASMGSQYVAHQMLPWREHETLPMANAFSVDSGVDLI